MAQRSFPIEFRGVKFAVTVEYDESDPANWRGLSATVEDGADFLDFLSADDHTFAEFDRLCDTEMTEFRGTRYEDAMDVVHSKIEDEMVEGLR